MRACVQARALAIFSTHHSMKELGHMDRKKEDWKWLPSQMPGVARLMADKRRELGDAHVNDCWKRGVLLRERGWFYAREGALAVGMPFDEPAFTEQLLPVYAASQAVLILRNPEPKHGAH